MKYMNKKLFLFIYCISVAFSVVAQVNMTLQIPPAGVLLKNQLWNMLLVSGNNASEEITVNLSLQDIQTNQVVLTGTSRPIIISKGATQLLENTLSPIQYNYYSSIFNNDRDPNGLLPAGNYMACYTINTTNHIAVLTENCIPVSVQPLSPPLLNAPVNESLLQSNYPQFTWLPPTPMGLFNDLNYDFVLVEVLPGQSSTEAIQNNVPVNTVGHSRDLFYNYPASRNQLDTSRLYAWRILARNGNNIIAPSDIWTFKIKAVRTENPVPTSSSYILIKKGGEFSGVYNISGNSVSAKYYSFDKEHEAEVKFLSSDGKVIQNIRQNIIYGDNFLNFPVNKGFQKEQLYFIEIKDMYNNKYTASFRIQ